MDYDAAGNRVALTDSDAGTTTYVYGANGKLLRQTDARGVETKYNFDNWGRREVWSGWYKNYFI